MAMQPQREELQACEGSWWRGCVGVDATTALRGVHCYLTSLTPLLRMENRIHFIITILESHDRGIVKA